jgi:hypothetical protein
MSRETDYGLVLHSACHLATTFRTVHTGLDAFIHAAYIPAVLGTGFADFGADRTSPGMETGIA